MITSYDVLNYSSLFELQEAILPSHNPSKPQKYTNTSLNLQMLVIPCLGSVKGTGQMFLHLRRVRAKVESFRFHSKRRSMTSVHHQPGGVIHSADEVPG